MFCFQISNQRVLNCCWGNWYDLVALVNRIKIIGNISPFIYKNVTYHISNVYTKRILSLLVDLSLLRSCLIPLLNSNFYMFKKIVSVNKILNHNFKATFFKKLLQKLFASFVILSAFWLILLNGIFALLYKQERI